jgi:integrase
MGVLVVERRGKFWISVNHKKKRLVRCLGAGKQGKKAAEQAAVQIAARLAQGDLSVLEKQAPPAIGPTFGEMAKAWPAWQQGRFPVRPATERIRESFLRVHLIPAFGTKPIAEITRMAVGDFIAAKRAGGMADSTIAVGLVTLSLILSFAVERSDIPSNPLKSGVRLWKPATRPGPDPFTREERDALVLAADVIDARWGLMVASWAATGMRSGEIRGLEVSDVNGGAIRVGRTYTFKASGPPKTPRGTRTVPMPPALLTAVRGATVGATGPLFPSLQHPGELMNEKELHRLWRRTVKAAGVRYRAAENLRHTRISIGLSDGEPLLKISAETGHSPNTLLKFYAAWLPQPRATQTRPQVAAVQGVVS